MNEAVLLSRRAVLEVVRVPAATVPGLLIPLFFLLVNIGQVTRVFPSDTSFLAGQPYVAFAIPVSMVFAVSSASSGVAMVGDIETGYLDKLRLTPAGRWAILAGRLSADLVRGVTVSVLVLLVGFLLGARVSSGILGVVLIIVLSALWGVAYAGIALSIALSTRNAQATSSSFLIFFPLLFLTPNFVPLELLASPLQEIARANPVTYVIQGLRDLVLYPDIQWGSLGLCVLMIAVVGSLLGLLSVRAMNALDR